MKQVYRDKGKEILSEILEVKSESLAGSLNYLLFGGGRVSTQSLYIKIGRNFEKWFKFIVGDSGLELLPDGVVKNVIGGKSKDIDLIFKNEETKAIYYRELKSNLELDTEKLPATYEKILKITEYLEREYKGYEVDSSVLHWSVFEPSVLPRKYKSKIQQFNSNGVDVSYPVNLFDTLSVDVTSEDYHNFFLELGEMC
tara:strand:- start:907 stop:1500 length:594 start_codon:yes stop_codon:yes gene_type:complete